MNKLLKFLNKYWIVISAIAAVAGTTITAGFHLKGMIDATAASITDLTSYVDEHDNSINDLQHRVTRLEALEEARDRKCQ